MNNPRTFFEEQVPQAMNRIHRILPEDVVVAFHIKGPGGGHWQVTSRSDAVQPVDRAPKDCEIYCSAEDFMAILDGSLSPQIAFDDGRLRVNGDIGLLLKLRRMFISAA